MRHHRTAQVRGPPLLRVLAHSLLRTPGFALSGRGRLPQSVAFPSSRTTPLTPRHLLRLLGPRAGSPPWRHRSPSASCRVSPSTLRGPPHLLGHSGGFQAATTGLLGDPKNKVFMTIVPEAIDALQLLNSRCVLKHAVRECIRRWKTDAVGATLARSRRRKGRQTLGWECLLGKCFRGFSSVWLLVSGCDIVQADHAPEAGVAQGIFHGILVRHHGRNQEEVEEELEEEVERDKEKDAQKQVRMPMTMDEVTRSGRGP